MTELEWRKGSDPLALLASLPFWRSPERRRRLILCGLCRLLWDALPDETSRRWVEEAEHYADGCIPLKDLSKLAPSDQSAWKRDMTLTSIRDPPATPCRCAGSKKPQHGSTFPFQPITVGFFVFWSARFSAIPTRSWPLIQTG